MKLHPTNSISISAWVYIDPTETHSFTRILSKRYGKPTDDKDSYTLITGNVGYNQLGDPGMTTVTSTSYNWTGVSGSNYLSQWVHICGTWDGATMKFYDNAQLVATKAQSGTILYDNHTLLIGTGNNSGYSFKGYIDDIRIYNRALSIQEVQALYTENTFSISCPNQTDTVGRWVTIPISTIALTTTNNVTAYQFNYNYDNTKLKYQNYSIAGTWAANGSIQVNANTTGVISAAWASQAPMIGTGTGVILNLQFQSIANGATTPTITNAFFNTTAVKSITNGTIISNYLYGDIDANNLVMAYDAALAIQYSVGLDPIPSIDPIPWDAWRIKVADVDGNGSIPT